MKTPRNILNILCHCRKEKKNIRNNIFRRAVDITLDLSQKVEKRSVEQLK